VRWYDVFARFYDRSLETLYRAAREAAVAALAPGRGALVLDLACGTGQNLDLLVDAVGPEGHVVGVDLSEGMLRQARRRVAKAGWPNVTLVRSDVHAFGDAALAAASGRREADAVLCTLGFTAFPDWAAAFRRSFALLRPGGRYAIMDVHARRRTFQTRMVELVARADLAREVWRPLEAAAEGFERRDLPGDPAKLGGRLYLAAGTKPDGDAP
jgi:demethylmenaquinone methyltransferase/2-methoxy-6-polyprenyl-1,4-benzoquinol methylase